MVAVIKYDVSDVEAGGGEQAQPGLYKGKIDQITHRDKKANGDPANDLEVIVSIGQEYARLWTYIQLSNPATAWKLREFTDALGLPPKGSIDPKKLEGKPVNVKVVADTNLDGDYRGRIKNLLKPGTTDEDGAEPEGALTREELEEWEVDDLKAELEERGLKVAGRFSKDKAIDVILEAEEEPEAEDEAEADGEFEITTVEGYEDFEDWSLEDIKEDLAERDIKIAGRVTEGKARAALIEAVEAEVNGDSATAEAEEEAEAEPDDDYDQWPEDELLDEFNQRVEQGAKLKILGRKTKQKLIDALRADDASEPF